MKRIRQTRYTKHRHSYGIAPGTVIVLPPEIIKEGKKEVDPLLIDTGILADLINGYPGNEASTFENGLIINNERIIINKGVCVNGSNKFRFVDSFNLLDELVKERALNLTKDQIRQINREHYKMLNNG